MDSRAIVSCEIEKNERKYQFLMPVGAPFGEAYDAAFEVLEKIKEMSAENLERVRRQEAEESENAQAKSE